MARKYDREFKVEAIRMAAEEDVSARGVEQRLGLSAGIISRWKRQLKIQGDGAFPGTGHLGDRDEEVRRLRRELARVSQERDILKKAAVYSIGQCNILHTNLIIGDVAHGSDGTTRIVRVTEVGGMASMEERPVA